MKKIICAVLCLMMLATFITAACADDKFSYTLQSRTITLRAPAKSSYKAQISGCLYVTFRRADHLSNGGTTYTNNSGTKYSGYGAVGKVSPSITLSVSANNSADDFVSAKVSGIMYYKK